METLYAFDNKTADALVSLVRGTKDGSPHGADTYDATSLRLAVATTGVPARSGTTLGKATVALKYLAASGADRVITDYGQTVTAFNLSTTAVGTGSYILLTRLGDIWIVTWEDCV
jgi:hypothetical protein